MKHLIYCETVMTGTYKCIYLFKDEHSKLFKNAFANVHCRNPFYMHVLDLSRLDIDISKTVHYRNVTSILENPKETFRLCNIFRF